MVGIDCMQRTTPIAATNSTRTSANKPVPLLKRKSPTLVLLRVMKNSLLKLDLFQCFLFQGDDLRWKRCVTQAGSKLLSIHKHPVHEIDHRLRRRLVLRILVKKNPRERRNG